MATSIARAWRSVKPRARAKRRGPSGAGPVARAKRREHQERAQWREPQARAEWREHQERAATAPSDRGLGDIVDHLLDQVRD
jgi:hypothetical protein